MLDFGRAVKRDAASAENTGDEQRTPQVLMRSGLPNIAARVRQISRRIDVVNRVPDRARTATPSQLAVNVNAGVVNTAPARSDFKAILETQLAQGLLGSLTVSDSEDANADLFAGVLGGAFGGEGDGLDSSLIGLLPRLDGSGSGTVLPYGAGFKYNFFRDLEVTSPFGPREFSGVTEKHKGLDLALPLGTLLPAIGAGRITEVAEDDVFGRYVTCQLDSGEVIRYAHSKSDAPLLVTDGQRISSGQTVGMSGNSGRSTGPHLHISV